MPGEPTVKQQPIAGRAEPLTTYVVDLKNRAYFISCDDLPGAEMGPVAIKDRFVVLRDGIVGKTPGSKLLSEKDIDCKGCPGREFVVDVPREGHYVVH